MRTSLLFAGIATVALLLLWAMRPQSEPAAQPPEPPPAAAPGDPTVAEPAAPVPIERQSAAPAHPAGSIAGAIVDAAGHPIATARITLVVDDAPTTNTTQSASDGRFLLHGAPDGAVAIRIDAAGFATAQRGDLHAHRTTERHLEVGVLTLHEAVLWHGVVTCDGRAVPEAEVTLAPVLGQPGAATPLVLRARTDMQGAFVFAQGPRPAIASVRCRGYRDAPPRAIDDPRQDVRFELTPLLRATGQVVRAEDGTPMPNARVALVALRDHVPGEIHARGNLATTALGADARFDLELPETPSCFVEVVADGRVSQARGPFPTTAAVGPLTIALPAGVVVEGTVTWRGEPIGGYAQLWAEDGSGEPIAFCAFRSDGRLRLSPAPQGRYLLRVGAERGAVHERLLDLQLPGPLLVDAAIVEGTRLRGSVRGPLPTGAIVTCRHATGWTRGAPVQSDGTFVVDGLYPGDWTVQCDGRGDLADAAAAMLQPLLAPQTVAVRSEAELQLAIDGPALRLGGVQGQLPTRGDLGPAAIELVATDDQQRRVPGTFRMQHADERGTFQLWPVLPGTWQVLLVQGDLRRTVNVVVRAGQTMTVTFPE